MPNRRRGSLAAAAPFRRRSRSRNFDPLRLPLLALVQRDPQAGILQLGLHAGFIDVGREGEAPDEPLNAALAQQVVRILLALLCMLLPPRPPAVPPLTLVSLLPLSRLGRLIPLLSSLPGRRFGDFFLPFRRDR